MSGPVLMKRGIWAIFIIYPSSPRKNARKVHRFYDMYRTKADAQAAKRIIKFAKKMGDDNLGNFIEVEIRPVNALWSRIAGYKKRGDWDTCQLIAELGHDFSVMERELKEIR